MTLHIDGPQSGKLSAAIANAFPNPHRLGDTLLHKLNQSIYEEAGLNAEYPDIRSRVISKYNAQHRIDALVTALLEEIPTNGALLEFAWDHGVLNRPTGQNGKFTPNDGVLQRMLDPAKGFSDPMSFLQRFGEIIKCVCRIAVRSDAGIEYGTGFLIGNETVITNYHVVQSVIEQKPGANHAGVSLLFDYHTGPDGSTITSGTEYKLIDDPSRWLVDSSKYDPKDLQVRSVSENLAVDRADDCLDYAILRVSGSPGTKRLGVKPTASGEVRGHLTLPPNANQSFASDFDPNSSAVFIFQHPSKEPLRLDWEKPAILGVNGNRTRALYKINTQHGSSGSPCLNAKLDLIALHHAGGKDWPADIGYLYNQGIPIGRIRALLEKRNKLSEIV